MEEGSLVEEGGVQGGEGMAAIGGVAGHVLLNQVPVRFQPWERFVTIAPSGSWEMSES